MSERLAWIELAKILECEWRGERVDRKQALEIASTLLPHHPEMRYTLNRIKSRMSTSV